MSNPADHFVWAFVSILVLSSSTGFAATPTPTDQVRPDRTVIEHAEIIVSPSRTADKGYLTLYNGDVNTRRITEISVDGYGPVMVVRITPDLQTFEKLTVETAFMQIPRDAELFMSPDTLFLDLGEIGNQNPNTKMTIKFDDGRVLKTDVRFKAAGTSRTAHHHGIGDNEY